MLKGYVKITYLHWKSLSVVFADFYIKEYIKANYKYSFYVWGG